ncbi:helix-turn-helix transcriptional regulator [Rhizobium sp. S152]|uniref:helix-turn-helix domain-containing protein n=1 Tax=Rhizobium sp. S152 TaxID=3055038 RepID=UPI0025AA2F10|nr:helix-turn-helix transcriptional regulator [Rhizobium sp. S152]MDM9628020.1 helix-turn-helix transcriptional regulator [Rhizobium sp. S152]
MFIGSPDIFHATDDTMGGRMSLARDGLGLSVDAVARNLGIEPGIWMAWENDRDAPAADRLALIADALSVSLTWLSSGHGDGPNWMANDNAVVRRPY